MLKITIPAIEQYDEANDLFTTPKEVVLQLEHSLVSLSKWESKWCKPFLTKTSKTIEETVDYIECMTLTQNVDPSIYKRISTKNIDEVNAYIDLPMTATVISKGNLSPNREIITSEIIYYSMIALNIPFECQKWHLTRLLTLINVCNIKNQPPKKGNDSETVSRNAAINEARKKELNSNG